MMKKKKKNNNNKLNRCNRNYIYLFRKNLQQYYAKELFHSNIKYRIQIIQNKNIILTTSFQTNYLRYE